MWVRSFYDFECEYEIMIMGLLVDWGYGRVNISGGNEYEKKMLWLEESGKVGGKEGRFLG